MSTVATIVKINGPHPSSNPNLQVGQDQAVEAIAVDCLCQQIPGVTLYPVSQEGTNPIVIGSPLTTDSDGFVAFSIASPTQAATITFWFASNSDGT